MYAACACTHVATCFHRPMYSTGSRCICTGLSHVEGSHLSWCLDHGQRSADRTLLVRVVVLHGGPLTPVSCSVVAVVNFACARADREGPQAKCADAACPAVIRGLDYHNNYNRKKGRHATGSAALRKFQGQLANAIRATILPRTSSADTMKRRSALRGSSCFSWWHSGRIMPAGPGAIAPHGWGWCGCIGSGIGIGAPALRDFRPSCASAPAMLQASWSSVQAFD